MGDAKSPVPEGFHTVTLHLIFDNSAQAIEWYKTMSLEEMQRQAQEFFKQAAQPTHA